jgi:SAM-dependent methyltransferase
LNVPWLKSGINKFIPSVIYQPRPPIKETLKLLKPDSVVLDVGAGGRVIREGVVCIDFKPLRNTDIVADIHAMPVKNSSIDCVFCTGVFEHIKHPDVALKEFRRILRPGGIVHLEVPFMQPFHADPADYYRWTLDGLRLFCMEAGFREIASGSHLGPASAVNAIIIAYWQSYFRSRYIRKGIDVVLSYLLFPLKYLDVFLCNKNHNLSSGVYLVGRKV